MEQAAPEAVTYGQAVTRALAGLLGEHLLSACLHGSGAMGGWTPGHSDVDLLFVIDRRLQPGEAEQIADAIRSVSCPGSGVELSVVRGPLELGPGLPPFEVHVTTGASSKAVPGAGHAGDADLILHFAVARARGVRLLGPPLKAVLPEVPRARVLTALGDELTWAETNAPAHYAVLNACRAVAFAETGAVLSKLEGAAWAETSAFHPQVAAAAARRQQGALAEIPHHAVISVLQEARVRIAGALERERQGP